MYIVLYIIRESDPLIRSGPKGVSHDVESRKWKAMTCSVEEGKM